MEVIKIEKNKLIFLLDEADMEKYLICTASGVPSLKESFSRIVIDNGVDEDFLSDVLVQIFDSKNGGCEMFVTKIPDNGALSDRDHTLQKSHIYIFSDINLLISACNMLREQNSSSGRIYIDTDKRNYYMTLKCDIPYLGEFGAVKCENTPKEYLSEHCKLMKSNAITEIAKLY